MASLKDLIVMLRVEARKIEETKKSTYHVPLEETFAEAIRQTMREIRQGANSDDFADLVVINFIISAAKGGYQAVEIKPFMIELTGLKQELVFEEYTEEDEFLESLITGKTVSK